MKIDLNSSRKPFTSHCSANAFGRDMRRDKFLHHALAHIGDGFLDILNLHEIDALLEHHLALIVHHVVELQHVLAHVEVARLDLLLRVGERLVDPGMRDGFAVLDAELAQDEIHALGAEDAHQVVFERQIELGGARIALTARPAAQLIVDAAAFVAFGAENVETAGLQRYFLLLLDIGDDFRALRLDLLGRRRLRLPPRAPDSSHRAASPTLPPSWMSVPRPAMLVAIVTALGTPACAMICASCSW